MEQERFAPQRVIGRIKLTEPKCSWQQLGGESLGCKGEFDVIKKKPVGSFYVDLKLYTRQRGVRVMCRMHGVGSGATQHIICLLPGSERTKRTSSSFVTYAANPWRLGNQSREERRGEGKVTNVFKCKDHQL